MIDIDSNSNNYDVLIIGGGLTGLRAAVELIQQNVSIALLSKVHPLRSHSVAAQGGINASLGNAPEGKNDTWKDHAFDTVKGSDYLADQDAVEQLCKNAPKQVYELEHMGTVFSRFTDGRIAQRPFGGANFPRTCYAADRTGHNLLHTLYEQTIAKNIDIFEEHFVTRLIKQNNRCTGCIALNIATGNLSYFHTKATLLATGGYGQIYERTTNALINTGDGAALALHIGVPLQDMEFVQFHPTTLYGTNILITEGARGEGGLLYNNQHHRFMETYAPKAMELAPRDIVARAIQQEINEGRGIENEYVHLDLTHLGKERILERLPGIRQITMDFAGIDPIDEPIPVQPGQHYSMGGIAADINTRTPLPGLYAAGEAACISVHGSNRLGGNSLLETVVFGKIAGHTISNDLSKTPPIQAPNIKDILIHEQQHLLTMTKRPVNLSLANIRDELKNTMFTAFGVFREEKTMKTGLHRIKEIHHKFNTLGLPSKDHYFNTSLIQFLEFQNMLYAAETIALGALNRQESRGSHYRTDYIQRNDSNYLHHTLAYLINNQIKLDTSPVSLGMFPVKERTY